MSQLHTGMQLALLNPFGVRLKERKYFLVSRNGLLLQQAPFNQVQMFSEHPVEVFQGFPVRCVHRLVGVTFASGLIVALVMSETLPRPEPAP